MSSFTLSMFLSSYRGLDQRWNTHRKGGETAWSQAYLVGRVRSSEESPRYMYICTLLRTRQQKSARTYMTTSLLFYRWPENGYPAWWLRRSQKTKEWSLGNMYSLAHSPARIGSPADFFPFCHTGKKTRDAKANMKHCRELESGAKRQKVTEEHVPDIDRFCRKLHEIKTVHYSIIHIIKHVLTYPTFAFNMTFATCIPTTCTYLTYLLPSFFFY